jgi:hypothetical protein
VKDAGSTSRFPFNPPRSSKTRPFVSISYRLDHQRGLTCGVWDGLVTGNDFLAHVKRITADPAWPPGNLHLTDLSTAIVDATIDDGVMKAAADLFGTHPKVAGLRIAVVAGGAFEKAGIFERHIARYRPFMFVFNSLNPACSWLGLDAKEIGPILDDVRRMGS